MYKVFGAINAAVADGWLGSIVYTHYGILIGVVAGASLLIAVLYCLLPED